MNELNETVINVLKEFRLKNGKPDMEGDEPSEHPFDTTWKKLADQGKCDGHGGAEYQRVRREYNSNPVPDHQLEDFIYKRANSIPDSVLKSLTQKP